MNGPTKEMHDELDVAVIGAGAMARHHARAIARAKGARVTAIAEPDHEARQQILELCQDAEGFAGLADLLRRCYVEVVHICTPPASHVSLARQALEAGKHVYVEKPFAPTAEDADELLRLANERDLHVCAGHQLLYESPTRRARKLLPALNSLVHLESYFSFRQVRTGQGGQPALPAELQLLDILPHPVYLLLAFLEEAVPDGETVLERMRLGRAGTVHALIRRENLTAALVVTLGGRPVESYLRLVGTNGTVQADYVRSTVLRSIGPGSSAIDKALQPYRMARQLLGGTTAALAKRILRRQQSYPGLLEIFEAFYEEIRGSGPAALSPESIRETARICEEVGERLLQRQGDRASETATQITPGPNILVTGGTGFVGREVVDALLRRGAGVRVLSRRPPPSWDRVPEVDYLVADLATGLSSDVLQGTDGIVHCAAETSGGWEAHERNSVRATEHLVRAAAEAGVGHIVHVSSIAVLDGDGVLDEDTPLIDGRKAGPYVWGKAESERRARELGGEAGVQIIIARPGAIVDWRAFDPPGRLGRRVGDFFVAVGGKKDTLGVIGVRDVASCLAQMAVKPECAPPVLNLIDPDQPTKGDLVTYLHRSNPDLRVLWVPRILLRPISWGAWLAQKALRPGEPIIDITEIFGGRHYDTKRVREFRMVSR